MKRRRAALVVLALVLGVVLVALVARARLGDGELPPIPEERVDPAEVPAAWLAVRDSRGHRRHVVDRGVPCSGCHDGPGFIRPAAAACARCHRVETPLHDGDDLPGDAGSPQDRAALRLAGTPACPDCHRFRDDATLGEACMSCHDTAQGLRAGAVGLHASASNDTPPCATCHNAHRRPTLDPPPCASCHPEAGDVRHAGHLGEACTDCHSVHDREHRADERCLACHAAPRGPTLAPRGPTPAPRRAAPLVRVEAALFPGHPTCGACHRAHRFDRAGVASCLQCHADLPVLGALAAGHRCASCHAPHDPRAVRPCATCHPASTRHPSRAGAAPGDACTGCHPIHAPALAAASRAGQAPAVACATCHSSVANHAAGVACATCHPPHGAPPAEGAALCTSCHFDRARTTVATGHADCVACHQQPGHAPARRPPSCQSCHVAISRAVRPGHADCASCHVDASHAPRAALTTSAVACASCHAGEQRTAPAGHQRCVTCHSPHDGAVRPEAACQNCHADRLRGHGAPPSSSPPRHELALRSHAALSCATCHRAHGPAGPGAPPACATCHQPTALPALHAATPRHQDCAACHRAHESAGRGDRATCLACHQDRRQHEPAAPRCTACHPFTR